MGLSQWFWRLFLVFAGLIVAHVLIVNLLIAAHAGIATSLVRAAELWTIAGLLIAAGVSAIWFCVRRIVQPLAELSRHVQSASTNSTASPAAGGPRDGDGAVSGAFDRTH